MGRLRRALRGLGAVLAGLCAGVLVYFETGSQYPVTAAIAGIAAIQLLLMGQSLADIHHRTWLLTREPGERYDD